MVLGCLQLSLAHFCENDGPTSILCTQVFPVSCLACWPDRSGGSSIGECVGADSAEDVRYGESGVGRPSASLSDSSRRDEVLDVGSFDMADLQQAIDPHTGCAPLSVSTKPGATQEAQRESRGGALDNGRYKPYKVLGEDGGCVSCSISLPEDTVSQLPAWAPGSPRKGGNGRNGSPVMRTTEKVFAHWNQQPVAEAEAEDKFQQSTPDSFASDASMAACHPHELIYRTTCSPIDPNTYSILRRATIRTLSCEQLPRGLTSGALSFADPVDGYTVAYKFRLSDPYARGCQRHYALIALVGQDPTRMYKVTAIIWRAFRRIAAGILARTERVILQGKLEDNVRGGRRPLMPGASFLTSRTLDPDGYPRRTGGSNMRARGLAEMVGDELIFAHIHGEFTYLLQNLGRQFSEVSFKAPIVDSNINDNYHDHRGGLLYRSSEDSRGG